MSIAKKVAGLFPSNIQDSAEPDEEGEDERGPTELYECEPCGTTYISGSMEECPNCGRSVEPVRSERELGMI